MAKRRTNNARIVWNRKTVADRCEEVGDCLIWRNGVSPGGCPRAGIYGTDTNVRNFVFVHLMGKELRKGHVVMPKCGNLQCVSDDCLALISFSVWRSRNAKAKAMTAAGRREMQQRALASGFARIGPELAAEMRRSGEDKHALQRKHGFHLRSIERVLTGESWTPIPSSIFNLGG